MSAFIPPLLGLIGLLIALGIFRVVLSYPEGNPEVKKIGDMIHSGAMSFMKTEYMYLVVFVLVLAVLVFFALGWETATAVLVGASSSALAGFIGMYAATKANTRTAAAAQDSDLLLENKIILLSQEALKKPHKGPLLIHHKKK